MKNRVILNVICILLIVISGIGIALVVNDVRTNKVVDKEMSYQQEGNKQGLELPPDGRQPMSEGEEPPEKPDGEMPQGMGEMPNGEMNGERPEMPDEGMQGVPPEESTETTWKLKFSAMQIVIVIGCSIVGIVSLILLVVTRLFSKNIFKDKKLVAIISIIGVIVGLVSGIIIILLTQNIPVKEEEFYVDRGKNVNSKEINLDEYDTNVTITESGEYTLTGSFKNSVLIETDGKVTLNLDGVNIEASNTAAIANINTNELIINLVDDTENTLSDGGSGDYDGCLYSNGPLIIEGAGTLNVYGNQEEGEGIATSDNDITINGGIINVQSTDDGLNAGGDNGGVITINGGTLFVKASGDGIDSNGSIVINDGLVYAMGSSTGGDAGLDADKGITINGGTVVALGSDMLESPSTSTQNYIAITLNNRINEDELITLLNEDEEVIVSFVAKESFKTIIISSDQLDKGIYALYQGGKNTGTLENNFYNNGKYSKGTLIEEIEIEID